MIIFLCIKYESNTLIFSKDNEQKPFFVRDVGMILYAPPHPLIENGGGIKTGSIMGLVQVLG